MNDLSQLIIFSAIENEEAAKNSLDLFLDIAGDSKTKEFSKQKTKTFLNMMYDHLKAKQSSPISKFYSLYMIKLIIDRSVNKVLSILASHTILKYLHQVAKETDPNKPISEKGKSLFDDAQLGNDYIRLILESLKVLAEKSKSSSQQPTKFKKYYDELKEMKIVLPKELKFYDQSTISYEKTAKTVSSVNQVSSVTPKSNASIINSKDTPKGGDQKYKQDVQMSLIKVNTFLDVLSTEEDTSSLRKQCEFYHKRFRNEAQKYQKLISTLNFEQDNEAHKVLALNDFYLHEVEYYQEYLANQKDYGSYTTKVLMASESLYQALGTSPPAQARMSEKQIMKPSPQPVSQTTSMRRNNHISDENEDNKQLVSNLISKFDQKSRSPNIGFKAIKQSLSKQKSLSRNKRSVSGLKTSKASKFGKSITKSRVSQIFTSPPNPYPKQRRYEGQLIPQNKQLGNIMREITKKQGIRRFITCNFKQKSPLFENTHIQIGVKSQGIYEDVNEFKVLIGIELYIGNKSQQLIKNMSINYKGSQDILLYGNPRTVQTVLQGGYQHKHQLLIVPLNYQFPLIKMYLKYSVNNQTFYQNITLPNSILKLASHGNISKRDFVAMWNASTTIYRTPEFKFTRYIPPDTLSRYIKPLEELASYEKFIVKGSENDYELGCQVILKQRYEGVVRVSVRPNFNAIIQVAIAQQTEQAIESFIFYAQNLQMLLTHVDHEEL